MYAQWQELEAVHPTVPCPEQPAGTPRPALRAELVRDDGTSAHLGTISRRSVQDYEARSRFWADVDAILTCVRRRVGDREGLPLSPETIEAIERVLGERVKRPDTSTSARLARMSGISAC